MKEIIILMVAFFFLISRGYSQKNILDHLTVPLSTKTDSSVVIIKDSSLGSCHVTMGRSVHGCMCYCPRIRFYETPRSQITYKYNEIVKDYEDRFRIGLMGTHISAAKAKPN